MAEQTTDVLIIGGGPAGMMCGITAAQFSPHKKVLVVRPESDAVIPCGIPYIFGTLGGTDEDMAGRAPLLAAGGQLQIGQVKQVDRQQRTASLDNGDVIHWERLVLATGADNFIPPISGLDLAGVFSIQKDYNYLDQLFSTLIPKVKRLAIIGGGFIGVEFADEIRKRGIEVHIIEMMPHLMQAAFDLYACTAVEKQLQKHGVQIHTGCKVEAVIADASGKQVAGVQIAGQDLLPVDAVLVAIGTRPRTQLAQDMGLTLSRSGGVWVDAFQRSREDPHIFAVGDCAHKQDFFTRKASHAMIASQAAAEGRIAGMNLYGLRELRFNAGSVSVYASEIDGLAFGVAGMTEHQAEQEGFPILVGEARLPDHHPAAMPNTTEIYCRVIFARDSLQLLGGQILGGTTTGELVNTIGLAVQMRATAPDLASMQFGSQPRLTPSLHPLVAATGDALHKHFQGQHPCVESPA
ncbi:FAD-dependent oxidoreductase [Acidithiobacillus sp. CV18-2]|uniref:FAD-dependent oxidoreductase n=1 Tax=Igneacidithiobacillus copahuensis TaxID=2724909 RepID=A0AAE3CJP1_9PROT|nr:FAD-dependent oxidoreductase [Igneacidithiobacillus copahuensis]MBU2755319.1 FAD-dependent oxidoreductase [Acidithiobacillus sp. CV18-3]MBU2756102.1 FAD-dependent oxidoreductase [Acidithiobacillus sp. BN09-2]MBU2778287.1 FAD-dependent oxidoreductase [Acidithiobacillus sp. CV18-2]MBU2796608.1 FAD-dependent oxidoreductase [Acidithiobacillus sp. VAN18-2]MBU2797989.1 FAD-dependent oxidoreductase [Acidithiobacillus sp. VAN18-4]UTV81286.1 FAD-dependent oxidoreductase [Acidithiobacillus sp. YTS05